MNAGAIGWVVIWISLWVALPVLAESEAPVVDSAKAEAVEEAESEKEKSIGEILDALPGSFFARSLFDDASPPPPKPERQNQEEDEVTDQEVQACLSIIDKLMADDDVQRDLTSEEIEQETLDARKKCLDRKPTQAIHEALGEESDSLDEHTENQTNRDRYADRPKWLGEYN
ncbi:hypothetical protein [Magnetococcus sp. PR-3]|uniref:hypothetical protein n=1 Tax=Magnetococcus sp. PR-3 TaxID=3120355 RepID=UPI002FCDE8D6